MVSTCRGRSARKFFTGGERLFQIDACTLLQFAALCPNEVLRIVSADKSAESLRLWKIDYGQAATIPASSSRPPATGDSRRMDRHTPAALLEVECFDRASCAQ